MLVVPSDKTGVGKFRSVAPHVYLQEHYGDLFDIDIKYEIPTDDLEGFLRQYDLIHIHKQLDKEGTVMDMIKFLDIKVIIDVDDCPDLGEYGGFLSILTAQAMHLTTPIIIIIGLWLDE